MSSGEASACGSGFAASAGVDCWANEVVDSAGEMTAREAIITNGIRIPASVFTATYGTNGKGGKERSIPAAHAIVIA
jgi:hypothetical protein